jgi:hypothetical protein
MSYRNDAVLDCAVEGDYVYVYGISGGFYVSDLQDTSVTM